MAVNLFDYHTEVTLFEVYDQDYGLLYMISREEMERESERLVISPRFPKQIITPLTAWHRVTLTEGNILLEDSVRSI